MDEELEAMEETIDPIPEPYQLTLEEVLAARRAAYSLEADPLFFGSERGENERQAWLDKIQEIKDRWPKPEIIPEDEDLE
jgi:hypothetical protein